MGACPWCGEKGGLRDRLNLKWTLNKEQDQGSDEGEGWGVDVLSGWRGYLWEKRQLWASGRVYGTHQWEERLNENRWNQIAKDLATAQGSVALVRGWPRAIGSSKDQKLCRLEKPSGRCSTELFGNLSPELIVLPLGPAQSVGTSPQRGVL